MGVFHVKEVLREGLDPRLACAACNGFGVIYRQQFSWRAIEALAVAVPNQSVVIETLACPVCSGSGEDMKRGI
jgi:hypothetical protein